MTTVGRILFNTAIRGLVKECGMKPVIYPVNAQFHSGCMLSGYQKSKHIGHPNKSPYLEGKKGIPRWQVSWLYLMKRKAEIEGEEEDKPRSDQLNWKYSSELNAFAHRLKIEVHADVIKTAFIEPYDFVEDDLGTKYVDNQRLFEAGFKFSTDFLRNYIARVFPKLGQECARSVLKYLTSEDLISYVADNLGYRDLVQSSKFPVATSSLHRCFFSTVAAIIQGPGGKIEAARFLNDFIIPNLIDKDIVHDIWKPKDPMAILVQELQTLNIPPPEVRLTKQSGINTVTPVFFIGLFCDRKLLSESAGESVVKAETDAAKIALKKLYNVTIDKYLPLEDFFSDPYFLKDIENIHVELPNFSVEELEPTTDAQERIT